MTVKHYTSADWQKLTTVKFYDNSVRTADPTGNQGVPILVDYNPTFNYAGNVPSLIGPQSTTRAGPAALVEVAGTSTYNYDMIIYGLPPIAFQNKHTIKNNAGVNRNLTPSWSFISAPGYRADGAIVKFQQNDVGHKQVDYWAQPLYTTINDGTIKGSVASGGLDDHESTGFFATAFAQGNITLARWIGFEVNEPLLDARLPAPVDPVDGVIENLLGIRVPRLTLGTVSNIGIDCNSGVRIWNDTETFTVANAVLGSAMIQVAGQRTYQYASAIPFGVLNYTGTEVVDTTLNAFAVPFAFRNDMIYKSATNATARDMKQLRSFWDSSTVQADTSADTMANYSSFLSQPTVDRVNSGTMTVTDLSQFRCVGPVVNTGCTVTTRRGIWVQNSSGAGTVGTNVGIDIDAMTDATVNIGIRNASRSVYTPSTQNITAASQQIQHTSSFHSLTANAPYTLTSVPTIPDGVDGQLLCLINQGTNMITLQAQSALPGSNLRLNAASYGMGHLDSTFLVYLAATGDWVQLSVWGAV